MWGCLGQLILIPSQNPTQILFFLNTPFYAPYKGARGQTLKTASSADKGYERTWATRAAAIAAKSNFKEWVNGGRSSQQRAAGAASAASRAETVQAARLRPLTPVCFCGSTRLEAAQVTVGLRIGAAGAVSVVLK